MKRNRFFSIKKILGVLICSLTVSLMLVSLVNAYRFYHNYNKCIAASGGRGDYMSVQYACDRAAQGDSVTHAAQNACASWLGGVGNPNKGTPSNPVVVYAASETATAQVALWGMCTDRSDRAVRMLILTGTPGVHGSNIGLLECINKFENSACFTRTGNWGNPNSQSIPLDVDKFIHGGGVVETGTTPDGKKYYQRNDLMVDRYHSDDHSANIDTTAIRVIIGEGEEDEPDLCKSWAPTVYRDSTSTDGHTRIVVKVRNTAGRFPKGESGDWHHNNDDGNEFEHRDYVGPIYAMPTDNIEWRSCYYPGVQKTAESKVSDVNDIIVNGGTDHKWKYEPYPDLPSDTCMSYSPKVGYIDNLWEAYEGDKVGKDWQNRYSISGDLGSANGGEFKKGSYNEDHYGLTKNDITRTGNHGTGKRQFDDVGSILTETGETGMPKDATITDKTPEDQKIYENTGHCCGTEEEKAEGEPCCSDDEYATWVEENPDLTDAGYCAKLVCTNSYENEILSASVEDGPAKDTANVVVPYNFKNSAGVEIERDRRKKTDKECDTEGQDCDDEDDFDSQYYPVFSGERVKLKRVWVEIGEKRNDLTYATYSTVVPEATFRLFMYVSNKDGGGDFSSDNAECSEISRAKQCVKIGDDVELENLNASGNLDGKIDSSDDGTGVGKKLRKEFIRSKDDVGSRINPYDAFDASAGNYLCFIAAVTPYTSGLDDATGDTAGDGMWRFGNPDCVVIYKRPTFQVWGGSLYSQAGVVGNVSEKRNLYYNYFSSKTNLCKGDVCFDVHGDDITYLSPWVEGALIINDGLTTTVASGAATGYNGSLKSAGNPNKSFCKYRAPLSFSNSGDTCSMSPKATGNAQINSGITKRNNLIQYWIGTDPSAIADGECSATWGGDCKKIKSASGETIRYIEGDDLTIPKKNVRKHYTYLVNAKNVEITGDIKYKDDEPYTMLAEIPKVIIYAKNIKISCEVNEVDAILITKSGGKVNTCSEYTKDTQEPNSELRSRRLKIFGTVMADKIYLGRTYGAAAWSGKRYFDTNNDGVVDRDDVKKTTDAEAAEVFDYDSTIPMWSEYMSGSAETDTLQIVYQHELAPRY